MNIFATLANIITAIIIVGLIFFLGKDILFHKKKLSKWEETFIMGLIVICYLLNVLEKVVYTGKEGAYFDIIMPTGNLSPMLFTITAIFMFLPFKWRRYYYAIVSLLIIGMLGASLYNGFGAVFTKTDYSYTCISFDCYGHVIFGLFGIYIIRNGVIEFTNKEIAVAITIILSITTFVVIHNAIFHTVFFGLGLYGTHNIYNVVITDNSIVNLIIYLVGLSLVLFVGVVFIRFLQKFVKKLDSKEEI